MRINIVKNAKKVWSGESLDGTPPKQECGRGGKSPKILLQRPMHSLPISSASSLLKLWLLCMHSKSWFLPHNSSEEVILVVMQEWEEWEVTRLHSRGVDDKDFLDVHQGEAAARLDNAWEAWWMIMMMMMVTIFEHYLVGNLMQHADTHPFTLKGRFG